MQRYDALIIGGGIVGLATARQLRRTRPQWRIAVAEKEATVAAHQTGHNSGVLHSGIYYKPGSLKATLCREGKAAMEQFCRENDVDYRICGKVIVATEESELPRLDALLERGAGNGVRCERIDVRRLREIEPHAAGIAAIHVPETGVVNYTHVCARLAEDVEVLTNHRVARIESRPDGAIVAAENGIELEAAHVINCAGLQSDRVTRLAGSKPPAKIIPFRGEYYAIAPPAADLCRALIYPVPDPRFPFLGVHVTRSVEDEVECGPNAVLAFAREGYRKRDISLRDLAETLGYSGFRKLAARYWRMAAGEMWRSFSRGAFLRAVQRLLPELRDRDLTAAPAGVRAQAVAPAGELLDDFVIAQEGRVINVINAPSPAATASLAIGCHIARRIA